MDTVNLVEDLERDEGFRAKPYFDCGLHDAVLVCPACTREGRDRAGILTIGIGRNLRDVGISRGEAYGMVHNDIEGAVGELDHRLPWWRRLPAGQQRALANMTFNMGIARVLGFKKALAALQAGRHEEAAAEMLDSAWARQTGVRATRLATLVRIGGPLVA